MGDDGMNGNIHIDGDLYVGRDRYNWILRERYEAKDKNKQPNGFAFRDLGYFARLSDVAEKVAEMKVKAEAAESVNALIRVVEKLTAAILAKVEKAA